MISTIEAFILEKKAHLSGIYIHVPFCRKACHYCDFHFSTSLKYKTEMLESMFKEIDLRSRDLLQRPIKTVYFGGGTPSLLTSQEVNQFFEKLNHVVSLDAVHEITLEANPDDLTPDYLKQLRSTPINRLSIGVQSFFDDDLNFMNRAHHAQQAIDSIKSAQDVGFEQLTIDLIYGSPTTSDQMWLSNLEQWKSLSIPHLSTYCLTVEEGTALHHSILNGRMPALDDEKSRKQFELLIQFRKENEIEHYEISNLCTPGNYAKHNTSYWFGKPYVGIGPSAHSFNGKKTRRVNVAKNQQYINQIAAGEDFFELEKLTQENRINEELITRLRTQWGISSVDFQSDFGLTEWKNLITRSQKAINLGQLILTDDGLFLPEEHWFVADSILVDLMV